MENLTEILQAALTFIKTVDGANIEICGSWLWVTFEGKPNAATRETLKAQGFRWAPKKARWYFREEPEEGSKRRYGKSVDMNKIRMKYGSVTVEA